MTIPEFTKRVQECHSAYWALSIPAEDDDAQDAAWTKFRQLVLDTARSMQAHGWGASAYYTAYEALLNSPNGHVIDLDKNEDAVDVGLRWVYFSTGHDYHLDMPVVEYEDSDEE